MGSLEEIWPVTTASRPARKRSTRARLRRDPTQRNDRRLPLRSQQCQKWPLTCGFEPEVGFEPTTFRLRVG